MGGGTPEQPQSSLRSRRERQVKVDSAPVPPSLWVGAYPLVTLLLRLTLLAHPLGSTCLTVAHDGGGGAEWG